MSGHTPGPWSQSHGKCGDGMYRTRVRCERGETIADIAWYPTATVDGVTGTHREANARLIAAAPDLLGALKQCAAVCAGETLSKHSLIAALEAASAAITKATGTKGPTAKTSEPNDPGLGADQGEQP